MAVLKYVLAAAALLATASPALAEAMNTSTGTVDSKDQVPTRATAPAARAASNGWNSENTYWRDHYATRPYFNSSRNYAMYEPAYRYGVDLYNKNPGKTYSQLNASAVSSGWGSARGSSKLDWNDAQQATRDAYTRLYESHSASSSNDANYTTATQ